MNFQGFVGPSYTLRSVNVDAQQALNLYPEIIESGFGKDGSRLAYVGTPGLSLLASVGAGPIRGMYTASNGTLYVVSLNKIYSVNSSWSATELGELNSNTGFVSMADNGVTLVCVDGTDGYTVTLSGGAFARITDGNFQSANQVVFQDGYFIFNKINSGQFFISGLNAVTFDPTDIATSEGAPDNIVGIVSDHRDLWIFNENTTEVFYNSGNADFPFERNQGAFIEKGCAARWSIQKMNNQVYWISRDDKGQGMIYRAQGLQPERISTHAVEYALSQATDLSTANAYTYQQNGHHFYCINVDGLDTTWVFDASTGLWHERCYNDKGQIERHLADNHAFAYSTNVVGDYRNGNLYKLALDVYTDNGDEIIRRRSAPHVSAGEKRVFYHKFELDLETGVGADGGAQGEDPQAVLQFSDDGGLTWSNEKWTSFGKLGNRSARCIWRRLGESRDRVFRVTISDPVKIAIVGADIDIEVGAS